jgi:hypothetical protein
MNAMLFEPEFMSASSIAMVPDRPDSRGGTITVVAVVSTKISVLPTLCGSDSGAHSSSRRSRAHDARGGAAERAAARSGGIRRWRGAISIHVGVGNGNGTW